MEEEEAEKSCNKKCSFSNAFHTTTSTTRRSCFIRDEMNQNQKQLLNHHHHHHPPDDLPDPLSSSVSAALRPDAGGTEGHPISLLANHFLVQFDPLLLIFHYHLQISPKVSKDLARLIKRKFVQDHSLLLSGSLPAFDGANNLYSPVRFQHDTLEFFVTLSTPTKVQDIKCFRINIRLVSKFTGQKLSSYLGKGKQPIPQEYLHALDVILRENPTETCIPLGRSLYSPSMGGAKDIGGGALGLRGFFQSLRPTQQGLALNLDLSVTAFHQSMGVIHYLQKRLGLDLSHRKTTTLTSDESKQVEKALKNIRVFVRHRQTLQRYRIFSLTEECTENLCFQDRDGKLLRVVNYFKDQYNYDIQYRNLPCLQVSRSKASYLPMELCVVCEGQKFLGKLSDDQTAKILKMGSQKPRERRAIINEVMSDPVGPRSGSNGREFNLDISKEMTRLKGRLLQPPKLKLGDGGRIRDLIPSRNDRQWSLIGSHVFEGTRIEKWAVISFGGSPEQISTIPRFVHQLSSRCEQLGIFLNNKTIISPQIESIQLLNNGSALESKIKNIQRAARNDLQLLVCIMEKKHKGYADLKRIAETRVGVLSQCCLFTNVHRLTSQFLANLALKINGKLGGCTVALHKSLPSQIPRLLHVEEPVIFMGADVTHPHPLDDHSPSVAAVVGSMNWPAANKYITRMRSQMHRKEIIQDLDTMVEEILNDFHEQVGTLPKRIIFFRDGVSETQFQKVLQEELQAIKRACWRRYSNKYNPPISFVVVQKRHHTRLFPEEDETRNENVLPGTVVDTTITHPREFDFYLCSHWGVKGTSRPTHYHILWDENEFSSDEMQKLVYNLCYTFVRCTKPVSIVPPAYYAHLAAYRGRLYLEQQSGTSYYSTRVVVGPPAPLPKLSNNIKKLMFYC